MPVMTALALIGAGIAAAGSVTSAVIGANAAHSAADKMAAGAKAAGDQALAASVTANSGIDQGVKTMGDINGTNQKMLTPYINAGQTTLAQVTSGLAPGGALNKPFDASMMEANDPGYAFRLEQGNLALERKKASQGLTLSGGTLKDLTQYAQGTASAEYGNAYSRYTQQQNDLYNKLMGVTSLGVSATGQGIASNEWYGGNQLQAKEQQGINSMRAAAISGEATQNAANAQGAADIQAGKAWGTMATTLGTTLGQAVTTYKAPTVTPTPTLPTSTWDSTKNVFNQPSLGQSVQEANNESGYKNPWNSFNPNFSGSN